MINNTKTSRIFTLLSESKGKGVREIELFDDFESPGNVRVIKYRLNKILHDRNAIVIKNGIWYLNEDYWNMTKSEFLNHQMMCYVNRFNTTVIAMTAIFAVLLVVSASAAYNIGRPHDVTQCLGLFGIDFIELIEE